MSTTEKGTFQMLWDCEYCGTEKLLGLDHRHCPCCGAPQDPERRYFPKDEDKVAVEDHKFHGADRVCGACSTPNGALAEFCGNCGSPLTEAAEAKRREAQTSGAAGNFSEDSANAASDELKGSSSSSSDDDRYNKPVETPDVSMSPAGKVAMGCFLVAVTLAILVSVVALVWKKDASMAVTGHSWERTIQVEAYKTVTESAWDDQVPSGAKQVRCKSEVRSYNKVPDGETCRTKRVDQGDGTYREVEECKTKYKKEPEYDDKCSYKIDKWVVDRTEKASGKGLKPAPSWPTVRARRGQEREGKRGETYSVHYKDTDGKAYTCTMDQGPWSKAKKGAKYTGKVKVMTGGLDCSSLKKK